MRVCHNMPGCKDTVIARESFSVSSTLPVLQRLRGGKGARQKFCKEIINLLEEKADLRQVVEGDWSPDGQGRLCFRRGIEVGHIFQLGDQYSQAMKATVLNDKGKAMPLMMGCYGIGISRIVAAAIEQHHDKSGIIWPQAMAPFQLAIVPMQMHKSYRVREQAEQWYQRAQEAGIDVLFDDRKERPGVLFSTMDLIGIPHRLVISEKGIDQGVVEYKARSSDDVQLWPQAEVMERLLTVISKSR